MGSNTSNTFLSLPFVDSETSDFVFGKVRPDVEYELHTSLSQGSLLGSDEVLAQFLTADGPLEEPDLNGPTTLHCEICRKQFDNAKKYYGHLRVHSKDNSWICDRCPDQKFSTKQQLMKHGLTHKPLSRMWKCPQCSMAFEALWRLQQHVFAKHLNYRPHKCDQCEKSFQKPSDLLKHKDMHSDERKHACPTCKMAFKDKSNLKRHLLTHASVKPFSCSGCKTGFKQVASMKRHIQKCVKYQANCPTNAEKNYCRVCGMGFQYKSALLEHCVREHTEKTNEVIENVNLEHTNIDTSRTEDNIVDDILSAEDDYMTISTQQNLLNPYNTIPNTIDPADDNLMQIEFLKEMNQLHSLDDELLYNDLDFDSFQNNQIFNPNNLDYGTNDRNGEIMFDFTDSWKIDQDPTNALYHFKSDHIPEELLNVPDLNSFADRSNDLLQNPLVSVNECATIFESDVDLEASTNLAANLNQLIGENSVQYISTEDDDTFIISLNNGIDAEQLTDMLNIGVEYVNEKTMPPEENPPEIDNRTLLESYSSEPIIVKIEEKQEKHPEMNKGHIDAENENKTTNKVKNKKKVLFCCSKCDKVFNKKNNYDSHIATHEPALRRHACDLCGLRFSYRSTLNKHRAAAHTPRVLPQHACPHCPRVLSASWMLKNHIERDHEKQMPYKCDKEDCGRSFYKKTDLVAHKRYHTGERPYSCDVCKATFPYGSHLKRHMRTVHSNKRVNK